jgi:CheY-like chemotaxis protein
MDPSPPFSSRNRQRPGPRIVVVDDTEFMSDIVASHLEIAGYANVKTFSSPSDVLMDCGLNGSPDIVITDYSMPAMNGLELLAALCRLNHPGPPPAGLVITAAPEPVHRKSTRYPVIDKCSPSFTRELIEWTRRLAAERGWTG